MKYRADIDGLRAIAVVSVCLFHAFPFALKGGFTGVDIFFVISGFLISSILMTELEQQRFSILDFYNRRIKRIFPSLVVVMFTALIAGWVILLEDEYRLLGQHLFAGSTFISNFVLWSESGYFDRAAESKPFLHLWSLAIEEQFYIFWPLLLALVWKRQLNPLKVTATIGLLSFALCLYLTDTNSVAAFYFPLSRFWELMVGGVLAYLHLHRPAALQRLPQLQSAVGLVLITSAFFLVNKESAFPGAWALLPTLGTALMIAAGPRAWLNRYLLSAPPMVWLGLISYPLYLWHWVLFSYLRIITPQPGRDLLLIAFVLAVLLSYLCYRWVETPLRRSRGSYRPTLGAALAMALLGISGIGIYQLKGVPQRHVVQRNVTLANAYEGGFGVELAYGCDELLPGLNYPAHYCIRARDQRPRFAVIGDSKAGAVISGLMRHSSADGRWLYVGGNANDGAPIGVLSDAEIYARHRTLSQSVLDALAADPDIQVVVFASATRSLFQLGTDRHIRSLPDSPHFDTAYAGLSQGVRTLTQAGKKVILLVDNPTLPYPQECLQRRTALRWLNQLLNLEERNKRCAINLDEHLRLSRQYRELLAQIQANDLQAIRVFDSLPYLCDVEHNECASFKHGRLMYGHTDHISDYAAGLIGVALNQMAQDFSKEN